MGSARVERFDELLNGLVRLFLFFCEKVFASAYGCGANIVSIDEGCSFGAQIESLCHCTGMALKTALYQWNPEQAGSLYYPQVENLYYPQVENLYYPQVENLCYYVRVIQQ